MQPTAQPTPAPAITPAATVKTEATAKVTLKSAKNTKGKKLTAKWKKVTGAKGYEVQYSTNKKSKKLKPKLPRRQPLQSRSLKRKKLIT